jgi:hypothetical protein
MPYPYMKWNREVLWIKEQSKKAMALLVSHPGKSRNIKFCKFIWA